jgi:hypothetical protein
MAFPVLAGRTDDARVFMRQLDGVRRADFDAFERRLGVSKALWFLAQSPSGDQLISYAEISNFNQTMSSFVSSREPFDVWIKEQMKAITGVDLNNPPADTKPVELLLHYEGSAAAL